MGSASGEAKRVAVGRCRIAGDIRFELPERIVASCGANEPLDLVLECEYVEQSTDRELVRIVVSSDIPGSRAALFDFTDRPGIPDHVRVAVPHRISPRTTGALAGSVRVQAECVRQPWDAYDVLAWDRAERSVPIELKVG